jgi:hypothetical protein
MQKTYGTLKEKGMTKLEMLVSECKPGCLVDQDQVSELSLNVSFTKLDHTYKSKFDFSQSIK